jgi:hypothetical protein
LSRSLVRCLTLAGLLAGWQARSFAHWMAL